MACKAPGRLHSGIVSELITSEKNRSSSKIEYGIFWPSNGPEFRGAFFEDRRVSSSVDGFDASSCFSKGPRGQRFSWGVVCEGLNLRRGFDCCVLEPSQLHDELGRQRAVRAKVWSSSPSRCLVFNRGPPPPPPPPDPFEDSALQARSSSEVSPA